MLNFADLRKADWRYQEELAKRRETQAYKDGKARGLLLYKDRKDNEQIGEKTGRVVPRVLYKQGKARQGNFMGLAFCLMGYGEAMG